MSYTDNPLRPNLRYWFSPIAHGRLSAELQHGLRTYPTIIYMQPGDSYEAPIYTAKQAYLAAINTMQNEPPQRLGHRRSL